MCNYCSNPSILDHFTSEPLPYCGRLFCYARWFHLDREDPVPETVNEEDYMPAYEYTTDSEDENPTNK